MREVVFCAALVAMMKVKAIQNVVRSIVAIVEEERFEEDFGMKREELGTCSRGFGLRFCEEVNAM